jgi:four helix bundle protein
MIEKKSIIKDHSFEFALEVIGIYKDLIEKKKEYVLSKQLLKSGTSVGANVREAQNAESKADFIHKLGIAQKECDETIYWLELLYKSEFIATRQFNTTSTTAQSLLKMIRSAILTTKQRTNS